MDKQPLVTIFILLYNNVEGLDITIPSVLLQDYENAEIIISDDGSGGYDTEILTKYAEALRQKYSDVKLNINARNMGTVKHLNKVFKMAAGKYLISCSSGDAFLRKDSVRAIVDRMENGNELLLTTRRTDVYSSGKKKIRPHKTVGFFLNHDPQALLEYMITKKNVLSGCCTFYAKELFETHGYLDESYHLVEDYPYYTFLLMKGVKIGWFPESTILHSIGGVSTGKVHPSIYKDIELLRESLYPLRSEFGRKTRIFLEKCHEEMTKKSS